MKCPKARIFAPCEPQQQQHNMFTNYGKNAAIKAWEKLMYPNDGIRQKSASNLDPASSLLPSFYSRSDSFLLFLILLLLF